MLPRQVQLVLQHSYRVSDGLDFKDETLHRQISAKLDVRSGLAVLQSGLGKLKSNRNYFVFLRMREFCESMDSYRIMTTNSDSKKVQFVPYDTNPGFNS